MDYRAKEIDAYMQDITAKRWHRRDYITKEKRGKGVSIEDHVDSVIQGLEKYTKEAT